MDAARQMEEIESPWNLKDQEPRRQLERSSSNNHSLELEPVQRKTNSFQSLPHDNILQASVSCENRCGCYDFCFCFVDQVCMFCDGSFRSLLVSVSASRNRQVLGLCTGYRYCT
jgi:hypothetical protein